LFRGISLSTRLSMLSMSLAILNILQDFEH
jgi:hypothetical protein